MELFGTRKWLDMFCTALNNDPEYTQAAKEFEGDMIIVSLPEAGVCDDRLVLYFDPFHGRIRNWAVLSSPTERPADYTLSAGYSVWKKICRGELDMIRAVMFRHLKVEGKVTNLIKRSKGSRAMMKVMTGLDTVFHDELRS